MKVILLNSPLFREHNELYEEDSLPPIGLGYIATNLRLNGIDVELIDSIDKRMSLEDIKAELTLKSPDFLGLNIFTTNFELVKDLIEGLQFRTHIVIGGLSTKDLYKDIITWNSTNKIDIVTGDGELIMLDIVKDDLKDVPIFSENGKRVFRIDQNSIYFVKDISKTCLDRSFFQNEPIIHPLGFVEANIVTSRGCVYNCTFCAAARSLNSDYPVREKTDNSIIAELKDISFKYPEVSSIRVLDDLFLKSQVSVKKAINVFSHFNFQWRSMAHVQTFRDVDEQTMLELRKSGCFEVFIGIESGSPRILSSINKTKDIDKIVANLTKVFRAGIHIKGYFIYGFPDETEADMEMTFDLAARLKQIAEESGVNFRTSVFQYRPYHSTQIYHDLQAAGSNMKVTQIEANKSLSSLVGRQQFNFHSGNYSAEDYETLESYIYRTINLNDGNIFSNLEKKTDNLQNKPLQGVRPVSESRAYFR